HEGDGSVPVAEGGWQTVAPSAIAFPGLAAPVALSDEQVAAIPAAFAAAARRALAAGFDTVELHAAHGYLLHQFLSPLSNTRTDRWGGSAENRARLLVATADAVRAVWPDDMPLLVRVSATDWTPGGLQVDDVAEVAAVLREHGVDLIDVSTGGNVPAPVPAAPGYQVPAARRVRDVSGLPVAAVGLITDGPQAERILSEGFADVVLVGRAALYDPCWPLRAARDLGVEIPALPAVGPEAHVDTDASVATGWPVQYERGCWS
ncbi:MAG: NADH:flavin oxidoreductase/NADH oxidase, partial [Micrococcales bacterium]|nr:NADH:flavin oxidoreductase/NADH oxidase [Micrococcales bacterium]